jgi:hydrogenase-4 component B
MTLTPVVVGAGLLAASGLISLLAPRAGRLGDLVFAALMVAGGLVGSVAAAAALVRGGDADLVVEWLLPWGRIWLHVDALSAVFLLPVFVVPALGAVYAVAYWSSGHNRSARPLRAFYGLLAGAMAFVVLAKDGVFFLVAWEVMALSAFFAVAAEDGKPEVRRAAWVYLVATHVGTLALIAMFALVRRASGRFDLAPLEVAGLSGSLATGIFLLALVGFGVKAGVMPLHVWLPGAHANAPSHVSAVLSGVMLKMGVYGLVRVGWMLPEITAWWGWLLLSLGAGSAVLGIALAIGQHDYKRLLAYSSIENIGVITLGLGAALLGRAAGDPVLTGLALAGVFLHVWNHALFKSLLFLVAGSVLHATGTRRMESLGGLAHTMPWTAALACVGCAAIGAMPPLNGFVSEWLIYRGLLSRAGGAGLGGAGLGGAVGGFNGGFAAAVVVLALTGALAVVAFARLFGTVFLGSGRSEAAPRAHEAPAAMLAPGLVLGAACVAIGLMPLAAVRLLGRAVALAGGGASADALGSGLLAPLSAIGALSAIVLGGAAGATLVLRWWGGAARGARPGTWDCGYARPSSRMQYGESSLAQTAIGLLVWVLAPRRRATPISGAFPRTASLRTRVPDPVLDRAILPAVRRATRLVMSLRRLQRGKVQVYMLYILLVVLVLLLLV